MSALQVVGNMGERFDEILTKDALEFTKRLHDEFFIRHYDLLARRQNRQKEFSRGVLPNFLPQTQFIREDKSWAVASCGPALVDRRVEITGPTDPKMTCNAMNSGAKVWMADLEDATSPTWGNIIGGQINLFDAIRRKLVFDSGEKIYKITAEVTPTIVARPRGLHMVEKYLSYTGEDNTSHPAIAAFVDFGLYFFHNAHELISQGAGPYFYLAKLESHLEARLWNDIFIFAQEMLDIPHGTVRATILIETMPAAFEMEEILWELRDHCAGLNAGRWDYIFSVIKNFARSGEQFLMPDRSQITMTVPFMRAYTELLVSTCHRRRAQAIGGMSAFIPNRRDQEITDRAIMAVKNDKSREARDGFDGTWVAHPDLIAVALAEFDAVLGKQPNQIDRRRDDVEVSAEELINLNAHLGEVTENGLRTNVSVGIRYIESWLRGIGAAAIDNLMEDVATAEISRSQIWQWIRYKVRTREGKLITEQSVENVIAEFMDQIERFPNDRFEDAVKVFRQISLEQENFVDFLTVDAYDKYM